MVTRTIADEIRRTGTVLRDWLTPYYTLGGVVMFGIGLLTLIDASGWLVRGVGAALLLATILAWAPHLVRRQRRQRGAPGDAAQAPLQVPAVLLAVTSFFLVGVVLAEAYRAQQQRASAAAALTAPGAGGARADGRAPAPTPAPAPAPAPVQAAPAAAQPGPAEPAPASLAARAPAGGAAAQAAPAPEQQHAPAAALAPAAGPASAPAPAAAPPRATRAAPPPQAPGERAPAAAPALAAQQRTRCTELLSRFSLGEPLQPHDQQFLSTTCR